MRTPRAKPLTNATRRRSFRDLVAPSQMGAQTPTVNEHTFDTEEILGTV